MAAINPGIGRARRLIRYRLLYWFIGTAEATSDRRDSRPAKKTRRPHHREDFIEEAAMMREMRRL
jgi:hypothetical protein